MGFQYYRAPTPDKTEWAKDLEKIASDGYNTVKYWIQWRWNEPEEGKFYFDDIDELMDLAEKNGLKVVLNIILDVSPIWLIKDYPESAMITANGVRAEGFATEYALLKLLDKITSLDVEWVRLLYCYPELLSDDLIKYIVKNDKICKYVDIPLQHIDDTILKTMGRRTSEKEIKNLIEKIRNAGDVAIRSTFIVGFPGETDEQFQKLYDFIGEYKLNYAGFFAYSKEDGTAAAKLKNQIPQAVKNKRLKNITALQSKVIFENNKNYVGKSLKVLYEGIDYDNNIFYGRPEFCAPEVDAKVLFSSVNLVNVGNFYDVKITGANGYDLVGEVK